MRSKTIPAPVSWKEPNWLQQYRERNAAIVKQQPLKKSRYSNIAFLDQLAELPVASVPVALPKQLDSSGVKVFSWEEALKECGEELRFCLENEFSPKDQFEATVNASFNSGFVLLVNQETKTDGLLQWFSKFPSNALAKIVILVKKTRSPVQLLETVSGENCRWNRTIFLEENCQAFVATQFDFSQHSMTGLQSVLKEGSELHCSNAWMKGEMTRARITHILQGSSSSVVQHDWNLGGKSDALDLNLLLLHRGRSSKSRSVFKSVLDQNAYSVFEGLIKILPSGQQSNAFLEAHGLLLSQGASNNSIPELEIEADDIKATHSASVSHLDTEALFYLLSRGLPEKTAKQLVIMGFLESLVHELPSAFHEPFTTALEEKWSALSNH